MESNSIPTSRTAPAALNETIGSPGDTLTVAGGSSERRATVQEEAVGEQGREQLESFRLAPWGQPTTGGSAEVAGSAEPDDC